ncbi:MAG TPA: hypothetical protein VEB03_00745, partial [Candidatus Nanoarchaeia archaeon]|nr:hypothetical protein [Candidatus Nanoarchaeia archaeon]
MLRRKLFMTGAVLVTAGVVTVLILVATYGEVRWSLLILGCLASAPAVVIAPRRFSLNGILDPLGLFCVWYGLYNGLLLIRLGVATSPDAVQLPYPVAYSDSTFLYAGALSALGAIVILITAVVFGRHARPAPPPAMQNSEAKGLFIAGLVTFAAGLSMYFANFVRVGGYLSVLSVTRLERFRVFREQSGGLPDVAVATPGLAVAAFAAYSLHSKFRTRLIILATVLWSGLLLMAGDRRPMVYLLVAVFTVRAIACGKLIKPTAKLVVCLVLGYLVFSSFGQLRWMLPALISGRMTLREAAATSLDMAPGQLFAVERSELAGPYITLLQAVHDPQPLQ